MEKSEFCVLIEHYFLRRKTSLETKAKLDKYYSDSFPLYGIVQKWFTEFRCARTSTETIPSPGRPNEITTPQMIHKIHDIVLNDPKVKVREITEIVSISTERVGNILHTHLCKMGATFTHNRSKTHSFETTLEQNLACFNRNLKA